VSNVNSVSTFQSVF